MDLDNIWAINLDTVHEKDFFFRNFLTKKIGHLRFLPKNNIWTLEGRRQFDTLVLSQYSTRLLTHQIGCTVLEHLEHTHTTLRFAHNKKGLYYVQNTHIGTSDTTLRFAHAKSGLFYMYTVDYRVVHNKRIPVIPRSDSHTTNEASTFLYIYSNHSWASLNENLAAEER